MLNVFTNPLSLTQPLLILQVYLTLYFFLCIKSVALGLKGVDSLMLLRKILFFLYILENIFENA